MVIIYFLNICLPIKPLHSNLHGLYFIHCILNIKVKQMDVFFSLVSVSSKKKNLLKPYFNIWSSIGKFSLQVHMNIFLVLFNSQLLAKTLKKKKFLQSLQNFKP